MIVAERVRERLAVKGLSQSELARRVGVTQGAIAKIVSGISQGSSHLHRVARELETTPAYLTGETQDPSLGAAPAPTPETVAEQLDLLMIPEMDIQYGMGGGTIVIEGADMTSIPFPRAWLESVTKSPVELLFFARGRGDSMQPTVMDGDIVLIDRSDTRIIDQDRIWAIGFGELGAIKRVRRRGGGGWKLMSDNPLVSDEMLADDEMFVVGRVIWVGRKI
ncbi:MAG TPA: S24 family peptidase [Sphingomonas sp.]|jgi:phage repressor protein C with HTH and peptisase S24 domain|uniref:XRE family transcriptional regulator n=1 Tax=Sphingomonas sp. TaxID=28214 RepID=UPI002ED8EF6F